MSTRKTPTWLPPVAFVGALALLLVLSNQRVPSPRGGEAISTDAQWHDAELKGQKLSEAAIKKYDAQEPLTEADKKNLNEAVLIYDKMTDFAPTISPLYFVSGKIHHILGEDRIAEERFRQCMMTFFNDAKARPQYAEGIRKTGAEASYQFSLLAINEPDKKAALEAADVAVDYVPNSSAYHTSRGSILNEMRKTDEAKTELKKALQLDPNNERARSLLQFISGG